MSRNQKGKYEKGGIYDSEYIAYCEHGDSAAVFIMRDIQNTINVKGKWIDVLSLKTRVENVIKSGWHDFEYFEVELFPKKIHPVYKKNMTDEDKKYETWKTAHTDITQQRNNGFIGRKYIVYPYIDIVRIPEKREIISDIVLEMFDPETNEWVDRGHGPVPKGYKYRKKEIEYEEVREATEDFQYKIRKIERIK